MSQWFDLSGETALVTGATRGIGAAIAATLAGAGARVIGTATTEAGAHQISLALGQQGRGAVVDVSQGDSVTALFAELEAHAELPSVVVNNAGITRDGLLLRMKDDDWEAVLATDLTSVFRVTRACLRAMMKQRKGRIITITSVVGAMGNPGQTNYAAAKAGVIGFTKSLAREVGSRGITVNAIAPGFIDTDMTRALDVSQRDALLAGIALGRLGESDDVAAAVLYLASKAGGYVTGQTLHVNGGLLMP